MNVTAMRDSGTYRFLVFLLVVAIVIPAVAQTTTATIKGKVTAENGDAIAGADVVATDVATGFTHLATTRADGSFVLGGLTPGRYTILVASPAYQQTTEERTVLVGQTIDLVYRLTPSTVLTEAITVVGDTFVETTHEVATNVTPEQIEDLPQNNRNFSPTTRPTRPRTFPTTSSWPMRFSASRGT